MPFFFFFSFSDDSDAASNVSRDSAARVVNRKTRSRQKSSSSGSVRKSVDSDGDDSDETKSGKHAQSRIDKWKAKHEAMLKQQAKAEEEPKEDNADVDDNDTGRNAGRVVDDDEEDEDVTVAEPAGKAGSEATSEEAPELPDVEEAAANGVCIEFERKNISKPHTRHNSVQQALSV